MREKDTRGGGLEVFGMVGHWAQRAEFVLRDLTGTVKCGLRADTL